MTSLTHVGARLQAASPNQVAIMDSNDPFGKILEHEFPAFKAKSPPMSPLHSRNDSSISTGAGPFFGTPLLPGLKDGLDGRHLGAIFGAETRV